ncbi:hypothetical protein, partial [Thiolapillus sp.]
MLVFYHELQHVAVTIMLDTVRTCHAIRCNMRANPNIAPERAKCGFFTMNYSLLRDEYAGYSLYLSCYPVFPGIF